MRLAAWFCAVLMAAPVVAQQPPRARALAAPRRPPNQVGMAVTPAVGPRGSVQVGGNGVAGVGFTMPMTGTGPGYSRRSGLQLTVDLGLGARFGYRRADVLLSTLKGATADRQIRFQLTLGDYSSRWKGMTVEKQFLMPAGATNVGEVLVVPQYQVWQLCSWKIWIDGQADDQLELRYLNVANNVNYGNNTGGPEVIRATAMSGAKAVESQSALQAMYSTPVMIDQIQEADLPTNWMEHTTTDVMLVSAEQFPAFVANFPEQAAALLRWVRAGGNLWVIDAGKSWQQLSGVNAAIDVSKTVEELSGNDHLPAGWRYAPLGERATDPAEGALVLSGFQIEQADGKKAVEWLKNAMVGVPKDSRPWFAVRGYGLGAVTAFRGTFDRNPAAEATAALKGLLAWRMPAGPGAGATRAIAELKRRFPGPLPAGAMGAAPPPGPTQAANMTASDAMRQSLLGPRAMWTTRHGNQPDSENIEFNNFLIPNVGVAPVGHFQFLITVFVLAIGPLNYWLLKRNRKLPLLLASVPVAAAVTTLLLFAYGMVVDGVAVRARTRTLTLLDQRSGEAVCWGRLSYYAGISPRSGLTVPADQAMFPIYPAWQVQSNYGASRTPPRWMEWTEVQRLTDGWLQSRTPTQYQAIVARPTEKRLNLRKTAEGLRVVNHLGVEVTHAAVQDHDGTFYWLENLPDEKSQVVPVAKQSDIATKVRRLFSDNLPQYPSGVDPSSRGVYYGFQLSQSLMEARLQAINSAQIEGWGAGKYIAFTAQPIELAVGVDAEEEASFHVVEGTW